MTLKFLGNGSAFSSTHTTAYFYQKNNDKKDLYIVDLSMRNVSKAIKLIDDTIENIFVLITHMHDDHCSGIGLFAEYCYIIKNKTVINLIVHENILIDVHNYMRITGVPKNFYYAIAPSYMNNEQRKIIKEIVKVPHTKELEDKCFGFVLNIDNTNVIYTGDTSSLLPFKPYITDGSEIYTEITFYPSDVHMNWEREKESIIGLSQKNKVYLMHIDNYGKAIDITKNTKIEIAETI